MSESGIAFVLAGCRMTEEERTAVVQLMRDKRTEGQRGVEAMEEDGEEITMDEHIPTENIEINDVYAAGVETLNQLVDNIQEIGSGEDIADESFLEVVTEELGEVMPEPEEVGTVEEITLDGEPTTKIVTNDFIEKHTPKKLIPQKSLIDENDKSNEIKEALKNPKSRRGPGKMKLSLKVDMMCSTPNKLQTPSPLEEKPVVRCPTRGCDRLFRDHKLLTKHTAHCGNAEANEMKAMESSEADIEVEITSAVDRESESVAFTSDEEVKTSEGSPPRTKSKIKCKFCPSFLNSMAALNKHCIKKHGQTESVKQETIPEVNEEGNREVKVEGKPGVKGKKGIKGRKIVEKWRVKGVKNEQEASGGSTETDEELVRQLLQRDPEVDVSTSSYFQSHPTMIVSLPSARLQMPNFIQNIKVRKFHKLNTI